MTALMKSWNEAASFLLNVGILANCAKADICFILNALWEHENLIINSRQDSLSMLVDLLCSNEIDLIFSDKPVAVEKQQFKNREIFKRKLFFVGHTKYSDLKQNFPYSLQGIPFCNYIYNYKAKDSLEKFLKKFNVSPCIVGQSDDVHLLQAIAEAGNAIVGLPENLAEESIKKNKVLKFGEIPGSHASIWAISRQGDKSSNCLSDALDKIMENDIFQKAY